MAIILKEDNKITNLYLNQLSNKKNNKKIYAMKMILFTYYLYFVLKLTLLLLLLLKRLYCDLPDYDLAVLERDVLSVMIYVDNHTNNLNDYR